MKEIEKLTENNIDDELSAYNDVALKINEIIDVVNMLIITHPKMEESAKMRKSFEEHMMSDSKPDSFRANND